MWKIRGIMALFCLCIIGLVAVGATATYAADSGPNPFVTVNESTPGLLVDRDSGGVYTPYMADQVAMDTVKPVPNPDQAEAKTTVIHFKLLRSERNIGPPDVAIPPPRVFIPDKPYNSKVTSDLQYSYHERRLGHLWFLRERLRINQ